MRLSALLLTLVIAFGLTAPLDAKTKVHKSPKVHGSASYKVPKQRRKPGKVKPMKYTKTKSKHAKTARSGKPPKAPKVHKVKPRSV